jgi:hypothetical protein
VNIRWERIQQVPEFSGHHQRPFARASMHDPKVMLLGKAFDRIEIFCARPIAGSQVGDGAFTESWFANTTRA